MKRIFGLIALVLALCAVGWNILGPRPTPAGQPPLLSLTSANLSDLQTAFNDASGRPRVLILLSPT